MTAIQILFRTGDKCFAYVLIERLHDRTRQLIAMGVRPIYARRRAHYEVEEKGWRAYRWNENERQEMDNLQRLYD